MEVNKIYQGNSLDILKQMPNESINCVMTSPPYWALRAYKTEPQIWDGVKGCEHQWREQHYFTAGQSDKHTSGIIRGLEKDWIAGFCQNCSAWRGELGLEPDFNLYIKHLCDIFDEVKRVLRKDGTCWVNIGDTYGGSLQGRGASAPSKSGFQDVAGHSERFISGPPPTANLMPKSLLMIPFRFAIEMCNRGWILRNTIIWHKRNCMPSSAKDRFTVDFEYLFFFTKYKKYYFETQYETAVTGAGMIQGIAKGKRFGGQANAKGTVSGFGERVLRNSLEGRNKRCVWSINPKPFKEAHFAVFPEELCITPIKAGCPENGIVLDIFFGAGTTGLVALKLNRKFIGIELNSKYIEIATKRLKPFLEQKKVIDFDKEEYNGTS